MSLDDSPKLKSALGLSSKSIVHNWKQSGVGGIPGYATHYDKLATGAKYAKAGGYIAIALDISVSAMKIREACIAGNDEQCERITYKESGRIVGSTGGGAIGGVVGAAGCTLIGIGTYGIGGLVCAIIAGGAGAAGGGYIGGKAGEHFGDKTYEMISDD